MDANPQIKKTFFLPTSVTEVTENKYVGESYIHSFALGDIYAEDSEIQRSQTPQDTSPASKFFKEDNVTSKFFKEDYFKNIKPESNGLEYSRVKYQWEGCITEVLENTFLATLTNENEDEFIAEFDIDDVSEDDKELIQENNIFYWSIGHRTTQSNQRINEERIIFRRLPAWRKFDINKPSEKAKKFIEFFSPPEIQLSPKEQRN